jgi:hypothetical protein
VARKFRNPAVVKMVEQAQAEGEVMSNYLLDSLALIDLVKPSKIPPEVMQRVKELQKKAKAKRTKANMN